MRISTVDGHVAGAAVRLVTGGVPALAGKTLRERHDALARDADDVRQLLCREPRGHSGIVGVMLAQPDRADADAGLLFFHAHGYSTFCGHALIGALGLAVNHRLLTVGDRRRIEIDTVAGAVTAHLLPDGMHARVSALRYDAMPALVCRARARAMVGRRAVSADIVWSGSELLAIVDAESAGVPLVASRLRDIQHAGVEITEAFDDALRVTPPGQAAPIAIAGSVFVGPAGSDAADLRSVAVYGDGTVDRSPSGSGTAAACAVLAAMGTIAPGGVLRNESLSGTSMTAVLREMGDTDGDTHVRVSIEAPFFETGQHVFIHEADDDVYGLDWA